MATKRKPPNRMQVTLQLRLFGDCCDEQEVRDCWESQWKEEIEEALKNLHFSIAERIDVKYYRKPVRRER